MIPYDLRRLTLLVLVAPLALGCMLLQPLAPKPVASNERGALREDVRGLARPHCGECHDRVLPTAIPKALAVFDLADEDWAAGMRGPQLKTFLSRIYFKLDAPGRGRVHAFLAGELASRDPAKSP
jgi:hypothetical protein